ncbi:hypothetical protein Q2451_24790, partial [Escherichia coli]|nr:hypothetical protein [Escherichia coli]
SFVSSPTAVGGRVRPRPPVAHGGRPVTATPLAQGAGNGTPGRWPFRITSRQHFPVTTEPDNQARGVVEVDPLLTAFLEGDRSC